MNWRMATAALLATVGTLAEPHGAAARVPHVGSLAGIVTDAVTALPLPDSANVTVEIFDATGALAAQPPVGAGAFEAEGLPPGWYFVRAAADGYSRTLYAGMTCAAASCRIVSGTPVNVPDAGSAAVTIALGRAGRITGTVQIAGGGGPAPILGVELFDAATSLVASAEFTGSFAFENVPAG